MELVKPQSSRKPEITITGGSPNINLNLSVDIQKNAQGITAELTEKSYTSMVKEITLLQGILMQCCFANAQAEQALKMREQQAMVSFNLKIIEVF